MSPLSNPALRADSLAEENNRLRLAMERHEEEQRERDDERHDREVEREKKAAAQNLRSKSLRARLCRTLDELCDAEDAGELALTCLKCAKLLHDPYVLAPCGHTLCAGCCGGGVCDEGHPAEETSGWVLGGGGGGSTTRTQPTCCLCDKQEAGGVDDKNKKNCDGMAPSQALATLVSKFVFRRQLLETLKGVGSLLWQEGFLAS